MRISRHNFHALAKLFPMHLQFGSVETTTSFEEDEEETTTEGEEGDLTTMTTEAGEDFCDPVPAEDPTECESHA